MRQVEYFRWWVTARAGQREYLTRHHMDAETAKAQYLTARPDASYRDVRTLPETEEERRRAQVHYQSAGIDSVQPPRR